MYKYLLIFCALLFFSFGEIKSKKRISDAHYRYEFYTTDKKVNTKPERYYYWFKGGAIHNSEYGIGGELLDDSFVKYYHSNQLAEAGRYDRGLKEGFWQTWFSSGIMESRIYWHEGQRDGTYEMYSETGKLIEKGKYRDNKKHGYWINYQRKDTLKYKRGKAVVYKITREIPHQAADSMLIDTTGVKRPGLLKRIFKKKQPQQNIEEQKPLQADTVTPKPGFFKRVFGKKTKTQANDGQGS